MQQHPLAGGGSAVEDLVSEAKAMNAEALARVLASFQAYAGALARSYDVAGLETDDLTQEALVGLFKAIRSYDAKRGVPFGAYAVLCMRRQVHTAVKNSFAGKHRPLRDYLPLEESFVAAACEPGDSRTASPEALLIREEETNGRLAQIESRLSLFEQEALKLYLAGRSYEEMAENLHATQKSVDNALQRVRRKLRSMKL